MQLFFQRLVPFNGKKVCLKNKLTPFLLLCLLYSLELLYLGGNLITAIPPEVANLPSLSYLVLCDNRIQGVPPQLTR